MIHRYQQVEHAILTLVLKYGNHQGYGNTLGGLANILREPFPDITTREIIDTLKRVEPEYITLWKYGSAFARLVQYSGEEIDDEYLFGQGDFCIQRTPHTDPRAQELALELDPPAASVTTPISEEGRKARFKQWDKMGLDRVKGDLLYNGGRNIGSHEIQELAWEWVRISEAEAAAATTPKAPAAALALIAETRLAELRALQSGRFDLKKFVRLCEEINLVYGEGCYFATAMLIRGVLDHVPPVLGCKAFSEVANNYGGGGKSFREAMHHLENAARKVADAHLHMPIRESETLPTAQQVNRGADLDVLLAEIVRIMQ